MSAVLFDNVSVHFGGNRIIHGLDLEIASGSTTAVLGPSGSGKSTLLNLVNGLIVPSHGSMHTLGAPIDYDELPALRRRIGYALQAVGLFPHLTVADNIGLAARVTGWSEDRIASRRSRLLRLMHLDESHASRYPHQLSGGQQQRAGLCRAMMLEPDMLLLDEPFSGVDPITRRAIHDEFGALLRAEPVTTLFVTHDPAEAIALSDHIVIVEDGSVTASGATSEVAGLTRLASIFGGAY